MLELLTHNRTLPNIFAVVQKNPIKLFSSDLLRTEFLKLYCSSFITHKIWCRNTNIFMLYNTHTDMSLKEKNQYHNIVTSTTTTPIMNSCLNFKDDWEK